jgi:hypothetical protein
MAESSISYVERDNEEDYDSEPKIKLLPATVIYKGKDYYEKLFCAHTQRNRSWKETHLLPQTFFIDM